MDKRKDYVKNKIGNTRAFTLAEALVTTIIMLLVGAIMVTGIPAAINAYEKVVTVSNAEVLLSTTMTSLRNELGTAKEVEVNNNQVSYFNENRGSNSRIHKEQVGNTDVSDIWCQKYVLKSDGIIITQSDLSAMSDGIKQLYSGSDEKLISEEASDKDKELHVTYDSVQKVGDCIVRFKDITVLDKNGNPTKATTEYFDVRIVQDSIRSNR